MLRNDKGLIDLDAIRDLMNGMPDTPVSTPRTSLYAKHEEICRGAVELMVKKNHDYACEDDPYRNFRTFGTLGVLVRLSDKLSRLRSFEENGSFAVEDEKLLDTVRDAINYLVIYYQMKQEGK